MRHTFAVPRLCAPFLAFALCGIATVSCGSVPAKDRGSLSDAMDKARDDHEGDRTVPDKDRDQPWRGTHDDAQPYYPGNPPEPQYSSLPGEPLAMWIGVRGGNPIAFPFDVGTHADGDIFAGVEISPPLEIDAYAGFKASYPVKGSPLDASVKDSLFFLKAGLEARFSPLPEWTFLSPFVSAGMGGFLMLWGFENPLTDGSEVISGDSLEGVLLRAEAGIYPLRFEKIRLGVSVIPELYLFGAVTQEGFDNDFFGAYGFILVCCELAVNF